MAEIYSLLLGTLCQDGSLVRLVHFLPFLCDGILRSWNKRDKPKPAKRPLKDGSRKAVDHLTPLGNWFS